MTGPLVLAVAALLASATPPALDALEAPPVAGREAVLRLRTGEGPSPGVSVKASYRQNAHRSITDEQEIGTTGPDGTLRWTPRQAGVVALSWEGGSRNVSVLHDGTPVTGVLVALVAGLLLLGGTTYSFVRMVRDRGVPPDTPRVDT